MPRALHKAARLGGKGVALLQRERSERRIGHIDAIAVGVELGGRGGILQIVLAVMLCHKGALDVGLANRTKHFDELFPIETAARGQCLRQLQLPGGRVDKGLQCLIHRACLLGRDISVLAAALIAQRDPPAQKSARGAPRWAAWCPGPSRFHRWGRCCRSPSTDRHGRHRHRRGRGPRNQTAH